MIELPLIFVAGFLGSAHCIGMCGPFAILLARPNASWTSGLTRQLVFSFGRIFTYAVLGAGAGFGGMWLAAQSTLIDLPAVVSIIAGLFLVYQGVVAAGWWRATKSADASAGACLAGGLVGSFLRSRDLSSVFIAGLLTGFLPCGLVYGFLGMAGSSGSFAVGALTMIFFGLGTIPAMVSTGMGGNLVAAATRHRVFVFAAYCLMTTGALTIYRGVSFLTADPAQGIAEACPLCQ